MFAVPSEDEFSPVYAPLQSFLTRSDLVVSYSQWRFSLSVAEGQLRIVLPDKSVLPLSGCTLTNGELRLDVVNDEDLVSDLAAFLYSSLFDNIPVEHRPLCKKIKRPAT